MAAIRDALGYDLDVAVDFHGRVHKSMAKVLAKELDAFHLMFIEEPVLPQNNEALREIARYTSTPISTGERMFSRWDFKNLLQDGYVDIIQPDLSHAGGISECKKIAAMAEAYDVAVAPHCPLGPVALSACVQLDICTPNVFIQEQSLGIHYNKGGDLLDYAFVSPEAGHTGPTGAASYFRGVGSRIGEKKRLVWADRWPSPFCGARFCFTKPRPAKGRTKPPHAIGIFRCQGRQVMARRGGGQGYGFSRLTGIFSGRTAFGRRSGVESWRALQHKFLR